MFTEMFKDSWKLWDMISMRWPYRQNKLHSDSTYSYRQYTGITYHSGICGVEEKRQQGLRENMHSKCVCGKVCFKPQAIYLLFVHHTAGVVNLQCPENSILRNRWATDLLKCKTVAIANDFWVCKQHSYSASISNINSACNYIYTI